MRQAYYRLAVNSQTTAYFSLCLRPANLALLHDRNQSRDQNARLSANIVENVFMKFEYPDSVSWEKAFTHVQECPFSGVISHEVILNGLQAFRDYRQMVSKESGRLAEARVIGSAKSLVHEVDLIIRRLISGYLKGFAGDNKGARAKELNATKAGILGQLRCLAIAENCQLYFELNELFVRSDFEELEVLIREKLNI